MSKELTREDLHWIEIVRRSIDGLAAIAEVEADGCENKWIAMQSSLEEIREIVVSIIDDYKERLA